MSVPYTVNDGVRVFYRHEGAGSPVVLHHGLSNTSECWYDAGYVEALSQRYQVICLDARGHGQSDKLHDTAAYHPVTMAGDVAAVLDALNVTAAHFFGYSMGGYVGHAMAKYAPNRLRSLVMGGAADALPAPVKAWIKESLQTKGMKAFLEGFEAQGVPDELRRRVLANDVEALLAYSQRQNDDDTLAVLQALRCPYLLIAGSDDPLYSTIKALSEQLRADCLVTLQGQNHLTCETRSDLVLPHLFDFFAEAEST